jgi:hypothetical protein
VTQQDGSEPRFPQFFPHGVRLFGSPWALSIYSPQRRATWIEALVGQVEGMNRCVVTLVAAEGADEPLREAVWQQLQAVQLLRAMPHDGLFWWTFGEEESQGLGACLAEQVTYLSRGQIDGLTRAPEGCAELVGVLAGTGDYLLVFDGVERLLHREGDRRGMLLGEHAPLSRVLELLTLARGGSLALLLSQVPLLDLLNNARVGMIEGVR